MNASDSNGVKAGSTIRVWAPATVANLGPGFDILGLCVDGLGDMIEITLTPGQQTVITAVIGRDAGLIPRDPGDNCAAMVADTMLKECGALAGEWESDLSASFRWAGG